MTLTAESNISKVEIAGYCKAGLTVTADAGTVSTGASYSSETTKSDIEDPLIVVDDINAASVTLTCTKQMRAYTIRITLGEGGEPVVVDTYTVAGNDAAIFGTSWDVTNTANDMVKAAGIYKWEKAELNLTAGTIIAFKVAKNHSWDVAYPAQNDTVTIAEEGEYTLTITFDPATEAVAAEAVKKVALAEPTDCATAAAAALSVSANNELFNNGAEYTIEGYVTSIQTAYNDQYHNITFWMADTQDGGNVLEAYRAACASEADAPAVGDKVAVTGKLTKYGTTPEFAAGCTYVIISGGTPTDGPTNCAEAAEAALSVSANNVLYNDSAVYTIQGFVTSIQTAYNDSYHNITFWMADTKDGGNVLEAYRAACASEADAPLVGDKVAVTGCLTKYNTTPEFAAGCTFTIIERGEPQPQQEIDTITVAQAIEATIALSDGATSTVDYVVEGYVVNAADFSWGSKQQIFFLADDAANSGEQLFEAYYCTAYDNNVAVPVLNGDKVQLKGKLTKYVKDQAVTPEIKNGTATFISMVDGDRSQPVADQITVARALQIGADVAVGSTSAEAYTIVGYVTGMVNSEDGGWAQYGNQIFWIADENNGATGNENGAFEVYQGVAPEELHVGDKISVYSKIKNYNGLLETETRPAVTILEKAGEQVEDADVVFTSAEFNGLGTSGTGSEVNVVKDGVTFNCNKGFGDQYGVRCYKTSNVTITSAEQQIGKIVFEFATVSGTYYNGGLDEEIVVNGMSWSAENLSMQARMNKVKIYFGEYEKPIVVGPDTINVAQAVEIGMALADNETTDVEYVVKGWVVQAYAPNEGFSDQTWFMADEQGAFGEFEAYRCTPDYLVQTDDFVYVKGKIQKYVKDTKVQIEIGKGTATHAYGEGIENIKLTEKAQKVVVDGVIYIVRDGKIFNLQGAQVR